MFCVFMSYEILVYKRITRFVKTELLMKSFFSFEKLV